MAEEISGPLRVTEPGIYAMSELAYHADPAPVPSLSRSIAKRLIDSSPAHAAAEHPRLNGKIPTSIASGDEGMDIGSAAHAAFLRGEDVIRLVPFDDFRSNKAKDARDAAIAANKIPLKARAYDAVCRVVDRLSEFRQQTGLFTEGQPEQVLVWNEGDHWARAMVDWLPDDPSKALIDLKTTGGLASAWGRACFDHGCDIQHAMYLRGSEFLRGECPENLIFVVIEIRPPYGIRLFGFDPVAEEIGRAKAHAARALWVQCMNANQWPNYSRDVEWIIPPSWIVRQWEEAKLGGMARAVEDTTFIERMITAGQWGG